MSGPTPPSWSGPTSVREEALGWVVQAVREADVFIGWYNYRSQVR